MKEQIVNYKQSSILKKIGFNWPSQYYWYIGDTGNNVDHFLRGDYSNYNNDSLTISCPTIPLVFKWLRDVKNIDCSVNRIINVPCTHTTNNKYVFSYFINNKKKISDDSFNEYEEAETIGLDLILNILLDETTHSI